MLYDLKGKVVLVTGGASGIGFSCIKELLRNGVRGATIADVNATKGEQIVQELMQEFGADRVIFAKIDVTKASHLEAAFKITLDFWKTIDIVINNAAIVNDNQWEQEILLNCNGVVQGNLLALQYMGKDQGGKGGIIVNVGSIRGLEPSGSLPMYSGTKHFVVGFSRSLADSYHYNRTGVKVLTICPGLTKTTLITNAAKRAYNFSPDIGQELAKEVANAPKQSVEHVSRGIVTIITIAKNGSVWIVDHSKPIHEVLFPHRSTFVKLQTA